MKNIILTCIILCLSASTVLKSQENDNVVISDSSYILYKVYDLPATPVKDQHRTGTCWAYATVSFLESEILTAKGEELDLSEMQIVRHIYPRKADQYIRYHGKASFSQGGQAHDAVFVMENVGLVPENFYPGLEYGAENHNHGEMVAMLKGMVEGINNKHNATLTPKWDDAIDAVLDVYLGETPDKFTHHNEEYTPASFAAYTGLNAQDYVELTSYNHHPFYREIILEVPDNWSNDQYFNLPLDDLVRVMEHAFEKGYSVVWDGDVSDLYFSHHKGLALVPAKSTDPDHDPSQDSTYLIPQEQRTIDQQERQNTFDKQSSTDDHLMHLTGIYKDDLGIRYYKTKNSWGEDSNEFGGYLYMSEPYIRLNTIAIMVNKKAIPKDIAKKLNIR